MAASMTARRSTPVIPDHTLRLNAHRQWPPVFDVHGDDRRLVQDDAPATHIHQGVGSAEIDGHVTAEEGKPVIGHALRFASQPAPGHVAEGRRGSSIEAGFGTSLPVVTEVHMADHRGTPRRQLNSDPEIVRACEPETASNPSTWTFTPADPG